MHEYYNEFLKVLDKSIEKRDKDKFSKEDVKEIYQISSKLFDESFDLQQAQLDQVCKKLVQLANGKLDKGSAMKKLQGTSRAEAIQSVLLSSL